MRLFLLSIFCFLLVPAFAADRITVSITVTNGTENGDTFTLNSNTRTFTNTVYNTATQVLTNSAATGTKTNLLSQIRSTAFAQVQSSDQGATNINLVGNAGLAMSASISGDWGFVTYTTQTVAQMTAVRVPVSGEPSAAVQTNIASALVAALNLSANTNELQQTSKASTQLLGTTNTQTVTGAKTFSSTSAQWFGIVSNSPAISGTMNTVSNGSWRNAEFLMGTNLIGNMITNTSGSRILDSITGAGLTLYEPNNGNPLLAADDASTAVYVNGLDFIDAQEDNAKFQSPDNTAYFWAQNEGELVAGTNLTVTGSTTLNRLTTIKGTNTIDGHLKFLRKANSALANGNNAAVDISTNSFVEVSGPTAAFAINGIANGSDGRVLILLNQTTYNMTIVHDSGVDPTAANRIYSLTGADRATTGNGAAMLIYSAAASRWILINLDE